MSEIYKRKEEEEKKRITRLENENRRKTPKERVTNSLRKKEE